MLFLQVDATEKAMLELTALGIEHSVKISVIWFGSFIALVWCVHPDTIKVVLKGTRLFTHLISEGRKMLNFYLYQNSKIYND